jgi:HK97 family phage prohead protease
MTDEVLGARPVERMVLLDDLTIRADGSGRIVEAYAAMFTPSSAEIRDQDGHYREENDPTSFNRTISMKGPAGFGVLFNHGRTVDGGPNPAATMPIGVPVEVQSDGKGVYTATRYLDNPLADQVLNAIKEGALKAQSYSGRFLKSTKVRSASRGDLPTIRRMEIDMREYGPAVFAAFPDAAILGTRSADMFLRSLLAMSADARVEWLRQFESITTPAVEPVIDDSSTPHVGPAETSGDSHIVHSARTDSTLRDYIRSQRRKRHM